MPAVTLGKETAKHVSDLQEQLALLRRRIAKIDPKFAGALLVRPLRRRWLMTGPHGTSLMSGFPERRTGHRTVVTFATIKFGNAIGGTGR